MTTPKLGTKTKVVLCRGEMVYFKLVNTADGLRWLRYEAADRARRFNDTGQCYPVGGLVEKIRNDAKMGALEPTVPDDYEEQTVGPYSKNVMLHKPLW